MISRLISAASPMTASQAQKIAALDRAGYEDKFAADRQRQGDSRALGATMGM
eukprot:CAMPEP_0173439676 /NCGR_PEP_ID=MMETSP1357-20121228/21389_1 /TAXON_ID=77926 /ORGANISM="Hemiselmis rufescens, Strain PCC563" /LENGTH=51 /DNA_ID=CAMNT_0014405067 /DNA_START=8 /DNA_END=163 /DNA_ORIENTATION=+